MEAEGRLPQYAQAEGTGTPLLSFNFSGAAAVDLDEPQIRRLAPSAGPFRTEHGVTIANATAAYRVAAPDRATAVGASFRLGFVPAMRLTVGYADGTERVIDVKTFASAYQLEVPGAAPESVSLPDAGVTFQERPPREGAAWQLTYYTRPRLEYRYTPDRAREIAANWHAFPGRRRSSSLSTCGRTPRGHRSGSTAGMPAAVTARSASPRSPSCCLPAAR